MVEREENLRPPGRNRPNVRETRPVPPPRGSWRAGEQAYMNVLALTDAELREIEANLEHEATLQIGSRAEIAVLSALTRRYDAIDTDGCLQIFDMIDRDRNGYLTKEELRRGVQAKAVRDYVEKTRNVTLKGLLKNDTKRFDAVFATIARCPNPSEAVVITKSDFSKFVRAVALERLRYMRVIGLLKRRCYWGRGLGKNQETDDLEEYKTTRPRESNRNEQASCCCIYILKCICCCFYCRCSNCCASLCCLAKYPKGYCADFWFYLKNHHPYLALFFRDEAHPFSRRDAFCAELIKQCYCLVASIYVDRQEKNWTTMNGALFNWKLSIIFVALPSMIIDECLFYALACPCLRFEHRGRKREKVYSKLESCGDCLGRFLVIPIALLSLALIGLALYVFYQNPADHADFALFWVIGLLSEYLFTWPLFHLFLHFNLWWPDCRKLPFFGCCHAFCGIWNFLACGRWATERRLAAEIALREDDDEYFNTFYRL